MSLLEALSYYIFVRTIYFDILNVTQNTKFMFKLDRKNGIEKKLKIEKKE
jgi:hypothetical protein